MIVKYNNNNGGISISEFLEANYISSENCIEFYATDGITNARFEFKNVDFPNAAIKRVFDALYDFYKVDLTASYYKGVRYIDLG